MCYSGPWGTRPVLWLQALTILIILIILACYQNQNLFISGQLPIDAYLSPNRWQSIFMITTHVQCTHIVGQEPSSWQNRQTASQSECPWSGKLRFKEQECILSVAFHFFIIDRSVGQGKGLISRCQLNGQYMGNKVFSSRVRLAKRAPSLLELSIQLYG